MKIIFDTNGNDKQKQVARLWVDNNTTDIVYGGSKGSGKSFLGVSLIFGDAFIYPETAYFIARVSLTNIRKFTIPSINEVFKLWGITQRYWKYNGQDNFYELHNGSRVYLLDAAPQPRDELYMRFGSMQITKGWLEESGEFAESAKNNLAASIGRWKNEEYKLKGTLLQTCNPSKNYLYRDYYRKFKDGTLEDWKAFVQALPQDNKKLPAGYLENLSRVLSKTQKRRLLEGDWEFDDSPDVLMPYEKILDCFTNYHVPPGRRCITVDLARLGGDRIVKIEWDGFRGKVSWWKRELLNVTGSMIEKARLEMGIGKHDVCVDEDGLGGGVVDYEKFKGFVNNSRALPSPDAPYNDKGVQEKENFDNLSSQCAFRMSDLVNKNEVYLDCDEEIRELIIEEMEQVRQKNLDSDLKKGCIPKDKVKEIIGRSPDFWDCFIAGTKILTPNGERNIEDIKVGDFVVTPNGNRRVLETIKKESSLIYNINNDIFCTGNHRFVTNNGLISADSLAINDYLYKVSIYHLWAWRLKRLLSTKAKNIGFLEQILGITTQTSMNQENERKLAYIGRFSRTITDLFQKDTTYITLTRTLSITALLIWLQLKKGCTGVATKLKGWQIQSGYNNLLKYLKSTLIKLESGISRMKEYNGTQRMELSHGRTGSLTSGPVNFAVSLLRLSSTTQNIVQILAGRDNGTKTRRISKQESAHTAKASLAPVQMKNRNAVTVNVPVHLEKPVEVYTLTVEKDHVYYANGYLVENCIKMRYYFELKPVRQFADAEY